MKLSEYFEKTRGRGVLATADATGKIDVAVYARPHFTAEDNITFIMADRLTHQNLQSNPNVAYLFMESGEHYVGKRLYLAKTGEEQDEELINTLERRKYASCEEDRGRIRYAVHFHIDKVLPLVGSGD